MGNGLSLEELAQETVIFDIDNAVNHKTKTYEDKKINSKDSGKKNYGDRTKDYDAIDVYMQDIKKIKTISRLEQAELFRQVKAGNKEAENKLVECNLPFVISVANGIKRYLGQRAQLDFPDMVQEGNLGLIKAVKKYEPDKINPKTNTPYAFTTYAAWWVKQAILRGLTKQIRLPVHMIEKIRRYDKICERMLQEYHSEPESDDIAERINLSVEQVKEIERCKRLFVISLELRVSKDDEESPLLRDVIVNKSYDIRDEIHDKDFYPFFASIIDNLKYVSPKGKEIFKMRYGFDGNGIRTLKEVGRIYGISRERVRQIEHKIREKIKAKIPKQEFFR
jgi:RNA polymerase primary sigma factor